MIEYLACGNIMSDRVEHEDGTFSPWHIGGPALYALAGIRLWTDKCKLVTQTGADYVETYGRWLDENGLSHESVLVEAERVNRFTLRYRPDDQGFTYEAHQTHEYLGYLKTHPYHIDAAAGPGVKGMYWAQNLDRVVWKNLAKVKEKHGFQIMWEIEYGGSVRDLPREFKLERIPEILEIADMWSINHNEASHLFDIPRDEDERIIRELMKLPAKFTLYRVGRRGAYAVTKTQAFFCPSVQPFGASVDPTGCGNNSTGAALYAWVEGYSPDMVVAMANVSAGYNAAQHGPYPRFTPEVMQQALQLAEYYREHAVQEVIIRR